MNIDRWEIWRANLDPVVGSEQGKTRPVLVLSETRLNHLLPVVNIVPLTSRKPGRRIYPNEALILSGIAGLTADSIAMAYQIRTLDKRKLINKCGILTDIKLQNAVISALTFQLGLT